jgi:transcription elongation factor GreA
VSGLRAWWALTDAPEEYEDALLEAFAATVPAADRASLPDTSVILPFANLRTTTGIRKAYGISGAVLPLEKPPVAPPTRVTPLPPGDADGARVEARGSGSTRRAPSAPRIARGAGTGGSRSSSAAGSAAGAGAGRPADPPDALELTADGLARLRAELDELIRVRRPDVIARIRTAKELGDLRENADYTSAREEQSFLEGRIQAIEARLRTAVIAGSAAGSARAVLGSRVRIERDDGLDTEAAVITIVGTSESDPSAGRISAASPVGRALLGRSAGDEVTVRTPNGDVRYRIVGLD